MTASAVVEAVSRDGDHRITKATAAEIMLLAGLGVQGDAHAGETAQHTPLKKADPTQPNLRQVHLIHAELHDKLRARGLDLAAGEMGENITTRGLDLLALSEGAVLRLGAHAVVQITGLRNPCYLLDKLRPGLKEAVLERGADGGVVRKAGIMGVVVTGGAVKPGDAISVEHPDTHVPLKPL